MRNSSKPSSSQEIYEKLLPPGYKTDENHNYTVDLSQLNVIRVEIIMNGVFQVDM